MSGERLIDLSLAGRAERRTRARRKWRMAAPFLLVAGMAAVLLLIAVYSHRANKRAALALSRSLVGTVVHQVDTEIGGYLMPAADAVRTLGDFAARAPEGADWAGQIEPVSVEVLRAHPQLLMLYSGDERGGFVQVTRMPDGRIDTKFIDRGGGGGGAEPRVHWWRRDAGGDVIRSDDVPFDNYDPRGRPWYRGAWATGGLSWTDVYVFFDPRKPGVTASYPVRAPGGKQRGVVGADIVLEDLSHFLAGLHIGTSGRAVIVDGQGRIVAMPDGSRAVRVDASGQVRMAGVSEVGDPVLTRAYNRSRIEGPGWRDVDVGGRVYLTSVSPLASALGNGWSMLVVVPEEDFVGVVNHSSRNALLMSLSVVAGTVVLATALGAMTLRSDRRARATAAQRERLRAHCEAFARMAGDVGLLDAGDRRGLERLTEAVAAAADVRRVSVWRLSTDGRALTCEDAFDRAGGGHTGGLGFELRGIPELARALESERGSIVAPDAAEDARTAGLYARYLRPLGLGAALLTPVRGRGGPVGALLLEDERRPCWHPEEPTFAQAVAAILGVRCSPLTGAPPGVAEPEPARVSSSPPEAPAGAGEATEGAVAESAPELRRYDEVTAMVIQLRPAERDGRNGCDPACVTLLNRVLCRLEGLAEARGVEHVTATGDTVICVSGVNRPTSEAAGGAAELALRTRQLAAGGVTEPPVCIRIGIHTGPAVGAVVGHRVPRYEFAGEAVQVASLLAASCPPGEVQVSQATYARLRSRYLLQERGRFYVAALGEVESYLLREAL